MDPALKHRLIGAAVLSALAIIFLPKLIVSHDPRSSAADVSLTMPTAPGGDFQTKELPLVTPAANLPQGGVVGMDASHPAAPAPATSIAPPVQPVPAQNASANGSAPSTVAAPTGKVPVALALPTTTAPSAPATAAPAPPIPAESAGGRYVVSLGTYSNAANAQSLVASLKNAQLSAYAEPVNIGGKMQTRVRIGPFNQRGDAEAARLKAQQVRTDMPATVTALDASVPAPGVAATPAPANKPVTAPVAVPAAKPSTAAPAAPTAKPGAPLPAAAGRGYVVQVSAFRSQDEALTLRDKLRAAGFTAFSEKIQVDSGTLYRVRIGPQADRDAADRVRTELSTKLGLSGMVVGYP